MRYKMSEGMANIGEVLKEAMERTPRPKEPEQEQEPVRSEAYAMIDKFLGNNLNSDSDYAEYSKALDTIYLTPPQRTWVGLSLADKEEYLALDFGGNRLDAMDWAARRLKEKNNG